jgi:hypothetical protein
MKKPLIIIESPFAGDLLKNYRYWRACMLDSINKGEAPFSSHFFYTQVLEDATPEERIIGIDLGFQWMHKADKVAFYTDLGVSKGMQESMTRCRTLNIPYEERTVGIWRTKNG